MKTGYGITKSALFAAMMLAGSAVIAAPNAKQGAPAEARAATAEQADVTPAGTAQTPAPAPETNNNTGATSGGGSFFVPPKAKDGTAKGATTRNAMTGTEVPEPGMIGLFGAGIAGLALARLRFRRRAD